jgi:hypothetical protein
MKEVFVFKYFSVGDLSPRYLGEAGTLVNDIAQAKQFDTYPQVVTEISARENSFPFSGGMFGIDKYFVKK